MSSYETVTFPEATQQEGVAALLQQAAASGGIADWGYEAQRTMQNMAVLEGSLLHAVWLISTSQAGNRHFLVVAAPAGALSGPDDYARGSYPYSIVVIRSNGTAWCLTHDHPNCRCIRLVRKALKIRADRRRYDRHVARLAKSRLVQGSTV